MSENGLSVNVEIYEETEKCSSVMILDGPRFSSAEKRFFNFIHSFFPDIKTKYR